MGKLIRIAMTLVMFGIQMGLLAGVLAITKPPQKVFTDSNYADFYECISNAHHYYDDVVDYINQGIDFNRPGPWGDTPLHIAARYDRPATTELLIRSGASIEARNVFGETPLAVAISNWSFDAFDKLLLNGAKVDVCSNDGMTVMMNAWRWSPEIYERLLKIAGHPDFGDMEVEALHGSRDGIRALIRAGVSVDTPNAYGWNPLQIGIRNPQLPNLFGFRQITMIEYSKNLAVLTPQGDNLLNLAVQGADHWTIRHLIKKGVNINHQNNLGETPLIQIYKYGPTMWYDSREWIPMMLQCGANPNLKDQDGWTALMYAVRSHYNWSEINRLLEAGADHQIKNKAGKTALDIAKEVGNKVAIDLLSGYKTPFRY